MKVRTRFAPSPTGFMHVGNLRTGLYAYLFARHNDGTFILRIEDTDRERYVEGATDAVFRILKTAGLEYDEGPGKEKEGVIYVQSERKPLYMKYALELIEKGGAYYCFCDKRNVKDGGTTKYDGRCRRLSKEEVQAKLDAHTPFVIRQAIPEGDVVSEYDDMVYGHIAVACKDMDDAILIKSDGMPTYNFANVIDDHTMGITHVLRGNEYLSSTPQYNLLYDAFGWERPTYIHLPVIMKDQTRKLSKRFGDANFEDFLAKGYLPEAIINYIALLGWSPEDNREKLSLKEMEEAFDISRVSSSPSIFDETKMRWLNSEYIRALSPEEFKEHAVPFIEKSKCKGKYDYTLLCSLLQNRTEIFSEIPDHINFLEEYGDFDLALLENAKNKTTLEIAKNVLTKSLPILESAEWDNNVLFTELSALAPELGVKKGAIMWCVRIAITGREATPGGATEMAVLLGRERTIERIKHTLERLQ